MMTQETLESLKAIDLNRPFRMVSWDRYELGTRNHWDRADMRRVVCTDQDCKHTHTTTFGGAVRYLDTDEVMPVRLPLKLYWHPRAQEWEFIKVELIPGNMGSRVYERHA